MYCKLGLETTSFSAPPPLQFLTISKLYVFTPRPPPPPPQLVGRGQGAGRWCEQAWYLPSCPPGGGQGCCCCRLPARPTSGGRAGRRGGRSYRTTPLPTSSHYRRQTLNTKHSRHDHVDNNDDDNNDDHFSLSSVTIKALSVVYIQTARGGVAKALQVCTISVSYTTVCVCGGGRCLVSRGRGEQAGQEKEGGVTQALESDTHYCPERVRVLGGYRGGGQRTALNIKYLIFYFIYSILVDIS